MSFENIGNSVRRTQLCLRTLAAMAWYGMVFHNKNTTLDIQTKPLMFCFHVAMFSPL
jgi:hypothetical protein